MHTRSFFCCVLICIVSNSTLACTETSDCRGLSLKAGLVNGVLVAELVNNSEKGMVVTDDFQSINPAEEVGFFLEVKDDSGVEKQYCAMINQEGPQNTLISPGGVLGFSVDTWVLGSTDCLPPGHYTVRVRYSSRVNDDPSNFTIYSEVVPFVIE